MRDGRGYLAALAELHRVGDADERRRIWRQGMAALAAVTERDAAPLEGLDPASLLAATRSALADGLLLEMDFLSPAGAATATFQLASALPPCAERRELGRRVLTRLRESDEATFLSLATSLALGSVRALAEPLVRARIAAALAIPPTAAGLGSLAFTLLSRPELAQTWLVRSSMGALPARRMAARLVERAAREAVRRHDDGDRGALTLFARPEVRAAWLRLLTDRESLVWRHAAIARGLLIPSDPDLAAEIDHQLKPTAGSNEWRRAATSLAAAVETRSNVMGHLRKAVTTLCPRDPGVAKAVLWGLAGAISRDPGLVDQFAAELIPAGGQEAVEAIGDLRREGAFLPEATAFAKGWLDRGQGHGEDDGVTAALRVELERGAVSDEGTLAGMVAAARSALCRGDIAAAVRHGRAALDELASTVEWIEGAGDDDPVERRHALRVLRELDQELLAEGTLSDALSLSAEAAGSLSQLGGLLERLEHRLVGLEQEPERQAPVPYQVLRATRLRVLVRLLDADVPGESSARRDRRLDVVRRLLARAPHDRSSLSRAVWAALARAWDALLRDEHAELSDLLICLATSVERGETFAVVREATMVPEVEGMLDAHADALRALERGGDDNGVAAIAEAMTRLTSAIPVASSPRIEAVRTALAHLARALARMAMARSQQSTPVDSLQDLGDALGRFALLVTGARRRLGLPVEPRSSSDAAVRSVALALERIQRNSEAPLAEAVAAAEVAVAAEQMPLVAAAVTRALQRLAALPIERRSEEDLPAKTEASLPSWLPLSRILGGFYVLRPIGKGAGGSVFVACRSEERDAEEPEQVALKVPDYGGGAARNLSEQEFEVMFREEAGALLALPRHDNLSAFITFDAGAKPKPILVMELVPGPTLDHVLEVGELDAATALAVLDGIAAGLESMHAARVAHLDIKPSNVILREGTRIPALVDFGLAGRSLRPGCGSPHYGAPEVWNPKAAVTQPFAADVYALCCLAYEVCTREVLVDGEQLSHVLGIHLSGRAGREALAKLARKPKLAPLAELIAAGLNKEPNARPTVARWRAGLRAIAPALTKLPWPMNG